MFPEMIPENERGKVIVICAPRLEEMARKLVALFRGPSVEDVERLLEIARN
jgi:hypothetical protein